MSVFKKLGRALRPLAGAALGVAGGAIGGPAGAAIGRQIGSRIAVRGRARGTTAALPPMQSAGMMLPMLPAIGRAAASVIPGAGRAVATLGRAARLPAMRTAGRLARDVGTVVAGGLLIDALTGQVIGRRRSKRINPMNVKAMRRSIRRVKAGRKICQEIDRMLPRRRASAPCPAPFARRKRKC